MIDRVSFRNFKCLRAVDLDLGRMTVLVGPNGCGKSSVLAGIHLLSQIGRDRPGDGDGPWARFDRLFSGPGDARRLARPGETLELAMREAGGDTLRLAVTVPSTGDEAAADVRTTLRVDGPAGVLEASRRTDVAGDPPDPGDRVTLDHKRVRRFASVVYLHLDAALMTRPSPADEEVPRMRFNGEGLASTLAWLAGREPDTLAAIAEDLARVVPGVRRILTDRKTLREASTEKIVIDGQPILRPVERRVPGDRFLVQFDRGEPVPADLLSEGTVLALGLLTKLREPGRPRLVLLDDLDRGLHISAQAELIRALRSLLEREPDLQIVASTHSPYLLDLLAADEVRVLALDDARATHARRLTDHPEYERWRHGVQTGELYAALGSAWVPGLAAREPT